MSFIFLPIWHKWPEVKLRGLMNLRFKWEDEDESYIKTRSLQFFLIYSHVCIKKFNFLQRAPWHWWNTHHITLNMTWRHVVIQIRNINLCTSVKIWKLICDRRQDKCGHKSISLLKFHSEKNDNKAYKKVFLLNSVTCNHSILWRFPLWHKTCCLLFFPCVRLVALTYNTEQLNRWMVSDSQNVLESTSYWITGIMTHIYITLLNIAEH